MGVIQHQAGPAGCVRYRTPTVSIPNTFINTTGIAPDGNWVWHGDCLGRTWSPSPGSGRTTPRLRGIKGFTGFITEAERDDAGASWQNCEIASSVSRRIRNDGFGDNPENPANPINPDSDRKSSRHPQRALKSRLCPFSMPFEVLRARDGGLTFMAILIQSV